MKISDIYEKLLLEVTKSKPIVAYHGSNNEILKFTDEFVGGKKAIDQEGPGVYFTTSKEDTDAYGKYTYKVILTPRKLLDVSPNILKYKYTILTLAKMAPNWEESAQGWSENPQRGLMKWVDASIDYNENEKDLIQQVWIDFYKYYPIDYVRNVVKLGYDGIIIDAYNRDKASKHIIVYNPAIIQIQND